MKMKLIKSTIFILLLTNILTITFDALPTVLAQEDVPFAALDDIGTHFELNNQYFNRSITTNTLVHIVLRAGPEMIVYLIENASKATSTQLTLGNLEPLTTYYMYEDSYMNETVFTTDDCGSYTYTQDLSQLHHVFIQPNPGTIFIKEDTTLQSDTYQSIEIITDNIVLDLNGYSVIGQGPGEWGFGIFMRGRQGVTIKNGEVKNWFIGIVVQGSSNNIICSNTVASNAIGIEMVDRCWYNTVEGNTVTSNVWRYGIELFVQCRFNTIRSNTISNNMPGLYAVGYGNFIYHNNFFDWAVNKWLPNKWDDGYPSGGNYWIGYGGTDQYSGPYQNETGSDGIGDTPYETEGVEDRYPLMHQYAQASLQSEKQVIKSWHLEHNGFEKSLISKLDEATRLLDQGNINGALKKLQDLIKKVTNDATHLTQEQKDYIIQTTQEIIDSIG